MKVYNKNSLLLNRYREKNKKNKHKQNTINNKKQHTHSTKHWIVKDSDNHYNPIFSFVSLAEIAPPMYLQKYSHYENETYLGCKASKNVYFSDGYVPIMTSYHAKMTPCIKKSTILDPPSGILILFRNVKKSCKFYLKK